MIAIPGNVQVWLATGHTDMRRGFRSLALMVQEELKRDPHRGDLYVFRGRQSDLIKFIWHDGQGGACSRSGSTANVQRVSCPGSTGGCRKRSGAHKSPDELTRDQLTHTARGSGF
jgi:IS66 Orf2 like protein